MTTTLRKKLFDMIEKRYPFESDAIIESLPDIMTDAEIQEQIEQLKEE